MGNFLQYNSYRGYPFLNLMIGSSDGGARNVKVWSYEFMDWSQKVFCFVSDIGERPLMVSKCYVLGNLMCLLQGFRVRGTTISIFLVSSVEIICFQRRTRFRLILLLFGLRFFWLISLKISLQSWLCFTVSGFRALFNFQVFAKICLLIYQKSNIIPTNF